jgi:hypothetical protein
LDIRAGHGSILKAEDEFVRLRVAEFAPDHLLDVGGIRAQALKHDLLLVQPMLGLGQPPQVLGLIASGGRIPPGRRRKKSPAARLIPANSAR